MYSDEVDDAPRVQVNSSDMRRANRDQYVRLIVVGIVVVSIIFLFVLFFVIKEGKDVQTMMYKSAMRVPLQSYVNLLDALDTELASLLPDAPPSTTPLSGATDAALSAFANDVQLSTADRTAIEAQLAGMRNVSTDPVMQIGDQFLSYLNLLNYASPAMVELLFHYSSTWMKANLKIVYDSAVTEAFDTTASFIMYLNTIHYPGDALSSSEAKFLIQCVSELHMTLMLAKTSIDASTSTQTNTSVALWNDLLDQVELLILQVFEFTPSSSTGDDIPSFTQDDNATLNHMLDYLSGAWYLQKDIAGTQTKRLIYFAINCTLLAIAVALNAWVVRQHWRRSRVTRKLLDAFDNVDMHHYLRTHYLPLLRQLRPVVLPAHPLNEVEREYLITARLLDQMRVLLPQLLFVRPAPSGANTLMARGMNAAAASTGGGMTAGAVMGASNTSSNINTSNSGGVNSSNTNTGALGRNAGELNSNGTGNTGANNNHGMNMNAGRRSSATTSLVNMTGTLNATTSSLLNADIKAGVNALNGSLSGSNHRQLSVYAGGGEAGALSRRSDAFGLRRMSNALGSGGAGANARPSAAAAAWSHLSREGVVGGGSSSSSARTWNILEEKARLQQGTWTCPYMVVLDIGLTSYSAAIATLAEAAELLTSVSSSHAHSHSHHRHKTAVGKAGRHVVQEEPTSRHSGTLCGNELTYSPVPTARTDSAVADGQLLPRHLQLLCSAYRVIVDEVGRAGGVVLGFSTGVHVQAVWNVADASSSSSAVGATQRGGDGRTTERSGGGGGVCGSPAAVALHTALRLRERLLRSVAGLTDVSMMLVSGGGVLTNMALGTRLTSTLISSMFLSLPKLQVIARSLHSALLVDSNTYYALPGGARLSCRPLVIVRTSDMVENATMVVYCLEEIANMTEDQRELYNSGFFLYQNNVITEAVVQLRRYLCLYPNDRVAYWLLHRVLLPRQLVLQSRSKIN